jgi:DNA polymerase V
MLLRSGSNALRAFNATASRFKSANALRAFKIFMKPEPNNIRLTFHKANTDTDLAIPLAQSSVRAGFPSPAQDYMGEEIDLNKLIVRHREATFYVRVSGDSMTDAGILDGDLAVVDKELEAGDGDFVIAYVDGEFTIKQFRMDKSGTFGWLQPWNDHYPAIRVDASNDFMIWGVVTYVIHPSKKG